MKRNFGWIVCAAVVLGSTVLPGAQSENINPTALFSNLKWRNIGPAYMVGRVSSVEGVPGNPNVVYVGSASGGVWKTINAGTQWTPIFDKQPIASIGDIALEPGNPDVVYVGTGESNVRNSVSFGNGVYKSTDGGKTWRHLGLEDTLHISRIVINPRDVRTLFVGALGHAYGPNAERGVYMSRDGGVTWNKVLYLDERHGVADMDINPENPNIVFAALWRFERKPWTFTSGDEEGGLFRSVDGGLTWSKVTRGLPSLVGRMSVKVAPSNPSVVYVMTESKEGTLYRSEDGGVSFSRVSTDVELVSRGFYYTDMRVDPRDENRVYAVSSR
ncbi:MAG: xyloglucanase precursor, partial [Acidobacteria bacterium]|nr:xyloglucanase precursor [Acidobacteriota bacterium]